MPVIVELPDGRELEFPDGMAPDAMKAAISKNFPEFAPKPRERTWAEAGKDTAAQLGEGVNNILGAVPNLVAPEGDAAKFFNRGAKSWRDAQSDPLKQRMAAADTAIDKAGADGMMAQISEAAGQYFSDPALAARFVTTNLPSMIPGIGAAKLAQAAALARGATAAKAAAVATTAAGGANAVLNAGGARGEAFEDIKATLMKQGLSAAEAEQKAIADSRIVAAIGGIAGFVSGKTGLEGAIAGRAGAVGAKAAARRAVGSTATELAGEQLEEVTPKLATNYQAGQYDGRAITKDVGRTMVETAIGSGPGAAVGGIAAWRAPATTGTPAPAQPPAPVPAAPAARIEPTLEDIGNAETVDDAIRAAAALVAAPTPRADLPTGADIDALENAYGSDAAGGADAGLPGRGIPDLVLGSSEVPAAPESGSALGSEAAAQLATVGAPDPAAVVADAGADPLPAGDTADQQPALTGAPGQAEVGRKYVRVTNPDGSTGFALEGATASPAPAAPAPVNLVRMSNAKDFDWSRDKPNGTYASIADDPENFASPFADDYPSGQRHDMQYVPKNPLVVSELRVKHSRFRGLPNMSGPSSAGIKALNAYLPAEDFARALKMSKEEVQAEIAARFPAADPSKAYDSYEALEIWGAQEAKAKGHDIIIARDSAMPAFSEAVLLTGTNPAPATKEGNADVSESPQVPEEGQAARGAQGTQEGAAASAASPAASGTRPAAAPVTRKLYHGTRSEFDAFDPDRSGGMVSFAESRSDARRYAMGAGGARQSITSENSLIFNDDGYAYRVEGDSAVSVGTWENGDDLSAQSVTPLKAGAKPAALTIDQARKRVDDGFASVVPVSSRIIEDSVDGANLIDTTTDEGVAFIAGLTPTNRVMQGLVEAAKLDIKTGGRAQFNYNFWASTKAASSLGDQLKEGIVKALKDAGYDGIRFSDDGHTTVGLFDTGLSKTAGAKKPAKPARNPNSRLEQRRALNDKQDAVVREAAAKLEARKARKQFEPKESEGWVTALGKDNRPTATKKDFYVEMDGKKVGRATIYREADGDLDLSDIKVEDSHRRRGIGSKLLDSAFLETGADSIGLSTGTTGDGTALTTAYGESMASGKRRIVRPARLDAKAEPAKQEAQPKSKTGGQRARDRVSAENPMLGFLATHGVQLDERSDTGGEKRKNAMVPGFGPVYRKSGKRLDELAALALEAGFLTQQDIDDDTDNGGTRKLADLIQRAVHGKEVIKPTAAEPDAPSADDRLLAEAARLGIDVNGLTADQVYDAVVEAEADEFSNNEARALVEAAADDFDLAAGTPSTDITDEELDAIFGIQSAAPAGASSGETQESVTASARGRNEETGAAREGQDLLSSYSAADVVARQDAEEEVGKRLQADKAKLESAAKKEAERRDVAARMDASADNFQLGQDADDALAGQNGLFDAPAAPASIPASFYSTVTVDHNGQSMSADAALESVREDISTYRRMIACMKG